MISSNLDEVREFEEEVLRYVRCAMGSFPSGLRVYGRQQESGSRLDLKETQ